MKKLFSILLTFVFILTMGIPAFADWVRPSVTADVGEIPLTKVYNPLDGPTTQFEYTIERYSVAENQTYANLAAIPLPSFKVTDPVTYPIVFPEETLLTTKNATITLPTYTGVGVYTYKITENNDGYPWVTYDERAMFLKVTVIQYGEELIRIPVWRFGTWVPETDTAAGYWSIATEKGGFFDNTYNFGSLEVEKLVTGNLGDRTKEFNVTVTFTAPTGFSVDSTIMYSVEGGTAVAVPVTTPGRVFTVTIPLQHDESVVFTNIPYGVTYTVEEANYTGHNDADGYENPVYDNDDGEDEVALTINDATDKITITNNKDMTVDTGISLDSLPYILLLAGALVGMGVLVMRRRRNASF